MTARDIQKREVQHTRAKSYDTFSCAGPWVVTGLSPADLRVQCRVNGQVRQDSRTSDMVFSPAQLVSFISHIMTLLPGDLISTGTPSGVGKLAAGDTVEVEIEGIGTLANPVENGAVSTATVYVGLGSNEGDREGYLVAALEALSRIDAVAVLRCSSLFDSAPVGPPQPRYLNAVVALDCGLPPQRLLTILQRIEQDLGRRRDGSRWGPRPIDLDILLWEGEVVADAEPPGAPPGAAQAPLRAGAPGASWPPM